MEVTVSNLAGEEVCVVQCAEKQTILAVKAEGPGSSNSQSMQVSSRARRIATLWKGSCIGDVDWRAATATLCQEEWFLCLRVEFAEQVLCSTLPIRAATQPP
eukprot:TRINITY_DN38614_c0_g1_i5.p3 TRINITY_DN38614_c0_g1~~TRINITY_DN38614_c0_g1_i5.p3  ORF type:complete len:102 (+),score=14.51 TRINITY_DN38614_c0_g1_i5:84-389(+)